MTNFAPNVTARYVTKYISAGLTHEVLYREMDSGNSAAMIGRGQTLIAAIFQALRTRLPSDYDFLSAKYCPINGTVFTPAAPPVRGAAGSIDPADMSPMNKACELNFIGRSEGTPISLAVFGVFFELDDPVGVAANGRVHSSESGLIGNVITQLAAETHMVANNGEHPLWVSYANYKVNDFWLREARKNLL